MLRLDGRLLRRSPQLFVVRGISVNFTCVSFERLNVTSVYIYVPRAAVKDVVFCE